MYEENNNNPLLELSSFRNRVKGFVDQDKIKEELERPVDTHGRKIFYKGEVYDSPRELFNDNPHHPSLTYDYFTRLVKNYHGYELTQQDITDMLNTPRHEFVHRELIPRKPYTTEEEFLIKAHLSQNTDIAKLRSQFEAKEKRLNSKIKELYKRLEEKQPSSKDLEKALDEAEVKIKLQKHCLKDYQNKIEEQKKEIKLLTKSVDELTHQIILTDEEIKEMDEKLLKEIDEIIEEADVEPVKNLTMTEFQEMHRHNQEAEEPEIKERKSFLQKIFGK